MTFKKSENGLISTASTPLLSRRNALTALGVGGAAAVLPGCGGAETSGGGASAAKAGPVSHGEVMLHADAMKALNLDDPVLRNRMRVKVMGSIAEEEIHSFLRFHVYGFTGDGNVIPMMSMDNYVVDYWTPNDDDSFTMRHYEVGVYTEFGGTKVIDKMINPITNEEVELFPFRLGPVIREYTPDGVLAPGLAPNELETTVIGDRVFTTTQSINANPSLFTPEEFPRRQSGETSYFDSMMTFSAPLDIVLDESTTTAPAHVQLQNMVSWAPWLMMAGAPGRTTVRAFGTEIPGFDVLPQTTRKGFEERVPEIFDTANWDDPIFETFDYYNHVLEEREKENI